MRDIMQKNKYMVQWVIQIQYQIFMILFFEGCNSWVHLAEQF